MMILLYAFALVAGIANAVQAGSNTGLAKSLDQPFLAALLVVALSALAIAAVGLVSGRLSWPGGGAFAAVPWWAWIGGALSAILLLSQLFVADKVGAGPYLGIIVVAGCITSLALDHFGLLGFKVHELNVWRGLGGALMIAGVLLIAIF